MKQQFTVKVKPGSRLGPLVEVESTGDMTVFLREKDHSGLGNQALLEILAKHLDVSKSRLEILRGLSSRTKVILVR